MFIYGEIAGTHGALITVSLGHPPSLPAHKSGQKLSPLCRELNPGLWVGLRNQFPFQISLKEPVWREELVLGGRLIWSPLGLVAWKKFTSELPPAPRRAREEGFSFSEADPELDFQRAQATEKTERRITSREGRREKRLRGRTKFAVLSRFAVCVVHRVHRKIRNIWTQ